MGASKKDQEMDIPKCVLNQLGEHTVGGFALFYFDQASGFPKHILNFDSPAHCLAMQKYMTDWCNALQEVYLEGAKDDIRGIAANDEE